MPSFRAVKVSNSTMVADETYTFFSPPYECTSFRLSKYLEFYNPERSSIVAIHPFF